MARRRQSQAQQVKPKSSSQEKKFRIEFMHQQNIAWVSFQQHDVLFMIGPAGVGKTHLACAFAIEQVLNNHKKKIFLTRPIVEAGESLGYLPGEFEQKVHPYMLPMYDCIDELVGRENLQREKIDKSLEIAPIAYMRGRNFKNAVCVLDEAQNATYKQIMMFLTRFGADSKLIISGDPGQSDLQGNVALLEIMRKLNGTAGIGMIQFKEKHIVRHPLVQTIIEKLGK